MNDTAYCHGRRPREPAPGSSRGARRGAEREAGLRGNECMGETRIMGVALGQRLVVPLVAVFLACSGSSPVGDAAPSERASAGSAGGEALEGGSGASRSTLPSPAPASASGALAGSSSAQNDCCSVGEGPGCTDPVTLGCLCAQDDACCSDRYDALCVAEAISLCALRCERGGVGSDCCTPSTAAGCSESAVEACVCGIDPFCCVGGFDVNCVRLAQNQCSHGCLALGASE